MTDRRFGEILDEYLSALEAGNPTDREALLATHPDLAEELQAALLGIDFVHGAAPRLAPEEDADAQPGRSLGDYRLLRELGRGGMAVVYEAEQVSLGRHVALKVLPFAAVLDPKHLQRFKNEAMAAAHLRHPNIVPVYGVGCERGVHYYAMQYVEGQSLATAIREMKEGGTGEGPRTPISSHGSNREPAYIRMAAALGVQAAEALDHAHQLGIVHRDVKPGNLLVDLAGTLWITDFGLAQSMKDVGLTITGELLGTIRYMSPEQALAKRVPVDHRTDVYSLGATLYELFTLEPAFPGEDPHLVIQDIAFKEPVLPRKLNPALPVDLETVLLKAMTKDPGSRYATAQEMADDIKRYLEDRPVLARRPSIVARAARWSRRHRGLVAASFVVLLLVVAALVADNFRVAHEQEKTEAALEKANANLRLARDAVDKFLVEAGITETSDGPLPSQSRIALLERALGFYANLGDPAAFYTRARILHALHRYEDALAVLDRVLGRAPRNAVALVERGHMLWHVGRFDEALKALDLAFTIDPGYAVALYYRGHVLDDLGRPEEAERAYLDAVRLRPGFADAHSTLGRALRARGDLDGAISSYRDAIRLEPDHAGAHCNLGIALHDKGDLDGAIREYGQAIRFRPDYATAHANLGCALKGKGDLDGAIRELREAIRLEPDDANAHSNLGLTLRDKGELDAAIDACREAIRLKPDYANAHCNLGIVLGDKGDSDGAIREFRDAIRLEPDDAKVHSNLGRSLQVKGEFDAAIDACREAIRLKPDLAEAHFNLGNALSGKGDSDGAIREFRETIRLKPDHANAHGNLGNALARKGEFDAAIDACRQAVQLEPNHAEAHSNLGGALQEKGDSDGAIREFREAIRLKPDLAGAHYNLGFVLMDKGDLDGAIAEYREAVRLMPDWAGAHCNLGLALAKAGDFDGAIREYREAVRLEPDFAAAHRNLETAERKAELVGRLDQVLSGGERPRDAAERVAFAELLYAKSRHAESARMYAEAFAEDAALTEDHRYNAACSAALAAARGGADAAEWRGRALEWLRADLAAREKAATGLADMLEHWKQDADLAAVRDRLDELPEPEREAWRTLWAAVDRALAAARPAAK